MFPASILLRSVAARVLPALAAALLLVAPAAPAGDRDDHERARAAVEAGQILPLREILARVEREAPGTRVLEVELERRGPRWIYELRLLQPGGVMRKLRVDARNGAALAASAPGRHEDD